MPAFILALLYIESTPQVCAFQPCYNGAKNKRMKLAAEVDDVIFSTTPIKAIDIKRAHECAKSGECSVEELEELKHGE